jgi:hypothetical protein
LRENGLGYDIVREASLDDHGEIRLTNLL